MHIADALKRDVDILVAVPKILEIVHPLHIQCRHIVEKKITNLDWLKKKIFHVWNSRFT